MNLVLPSWMQRFLAGTLAVLLVLGTPASLLAEVTSTRAASVEALVTPDQTPDEASKDGSKTDFLRVTAGFLVTTGIRYFVGGLAHTPWMMHTLAATPGLGIAAMVGVSFLESGLSIAAFQAIAGIKANQNMVAAFLLSAAASSLLTPLLLGTMGPVGGILSAVVTNAIRLALFNLIVRKKGESIDLLNLASPLTAIAEESEKDEGASEQASITVSPPENLTLLQGSVAELEQLTRERYQKLVDTSGALESQEFQDYLVARQSLDRAIEAQSR